MNSTYSTLPIQIIDLIKFLADPRFCNFY